MKQKPNMSNVLRKAMDDGLAFSWLSSGLVCLQWSAHYALRGWYGRGRNCM